MKKSELAPFYAIYPEKFNNKTNGITFRRWLMACNPAAEPTGSPRSSARAGSSDANELEKLLAYKDDAAVAARPCYAIKASNKRALAVPALNPWTGGSGRVFDIQIKRLHEYKRQQMNALYAIYKYLEIKAGKRPAAAHHALVRRQGCARLYPGQGHHPSHPLPCAGRSREDPQVSPWLNIVMVENYNVTWAEKSNPRVRHLRADFPGLQGGQRHRQHEIHAQRRASPWARMDGANVEISQLVGEENIYIFRQIAATRSSRRYAEHAYCSRGATTRAIR